MSQHVQERPVIALVANTAWSIYRFRLGLAHTLKKKGFEVLLIAPNDAYAALLIRESFTFVPIEMRQHRANIWSELSIVHQLYSIYRRYKPVIVFHYTIKPNIYGSIAARLLGIPCVAVVTGLGQFLSNRSWMAQQCLDALYRVGCACSSAVWFLNHDDRQIFLDRNIVQATKIQVLPSEGIDVELFRPPATSEPPSQPVFLFAGRLLREKGILLFVEAARRIRLVRPDVRFQVLGFIDTENPDSVSHAVVKNWIANQWIEYLGESDDVATYIADCSCLVLPSYREGVPRTLLEAASMAKPIITSNSVGCREVVEHGVNGFLCTPGNIEHLIETIVYFLQLSISEQVLLGQRGRQMVINTFNEQVVVQHYINALLDYKIISPASVISA
jgi:glycosyltransferase involved in cell wall biosynthesis